MEVLLLVLSSGIIAAGVYTDLRFRKVPNKLALALFILAFVAKVAFFGKAGLVEGLLGTGAVLALMLPLVLAKALGAGDMKLMFSFGMATGWYIVFWTLVYSLVWGAILGLVRAILNKQAGNLFMGAWSIVATRGKASTDKMHTIPYTVAMAFGYATFLSLNGFRIYPGFGL